MLNLARALYEQVSRDRLSIVALYGLAFDVGQVERQVASLAGLLPRDARWRPRSSC